MLMNNAETQAVAQADALKAAQTLAELWARVGCLVRVRPYAEPSIHRVMAAVYEPRNPIPAEDQRPRFVVLDDEHHAADGTRYRPGVWHFGSKPGRGNAPPS